MNNRLANIIDIKKYPIQDLNSPLMKELIKKCNSDLDQVSCSTIPNFILPKSLKIMDAELEKQLDEVICQNKVSMFICILKMILHCPKIIQKEYLWIVTMDI